MKVAGIDGCRDGWVAVTLDDGSFEAAHVFSDMTGAVDSFGDVTVLGVDIPIGLLASGRRQADLAAKQFLAARASTVFFTPPRPVLLATPYEQANKVSKEQYGFGISAQSYALRGKILEVEAIASADDRFFEVHPEVTFRMLAGEPLPSKKSWQGAAMRRHLLERTGLALPDDLGPAGRVPVDDVLDAAAAAVSASRVAAGSALSLPDPPERDQHGRAVAIWY